MSEGISVFPNPTAAKANISFVLPGRFITTIEIVNTLGQVITRPVSKVLDAGQHTESIDLGDVASGVYSVILRSDAFTLTGKLLISR